MPMVFTAMARASINLSTPRCCEWMKLQGSVLGPTIFSLLVNDLPKAITGATTLLFADDTTIYAIGKDMTFIAETLTSALHLASEWMCDNHLRLNVQKT